MLNIIPTPLFEKTDKNKIFEIKSIHLQSDKISNDVLNDFYNFLSKTDIKQ